MPVPPGCCTTIGAARSMPFGTVIAATTKREKSEVLRMEITLGSEIVMNDDESIKRCRSCGLCGLFRYANASADPQSIINWGHRTKFHIDLAEFPLKLDVVALF